MLNNTNFHIGVGCWVFNPDGLVLLGRRLSIHGYGTWAAPGGHLDTDEMPAHCAARELREETGIIIPQKNFHIIGVTYDAYPRNPYVTLHYRVNDVTATPKLREPDKCDEWRWFALKELPQPLFLSAKNLLSAHPKL